MAEDNVPNPRQMGSIHINMTAEQDTALEKTLTANLGRVIDWIKFAEAKNAALLRGGFHNHPGLS